MATRTSASCRETWPETPRSVTPAPLPKERSPWTTSATIDRAYSPRSTGTPDDRPNAFHSGLATPLGSVRPPLPNAPLHPLFPPSLRATPRLATQPNPPKPHQGAIHTKVDRRRPFPIWTYLVGPKGSQTQGTLLSIRRPPLADAEAHPGAHPGPAPLFERGPRAWGPPALPIAWAMCLTSKPCCERATDGSFYSHKSMDACRGLTSEKILVSLRPSKGAGVVKLVDTPDLGSGASACGFESLHPHFFEEKPAT